MSDLGILGDLILKARHTTTYIWNSSLLWRLLSVSSSPYPRPLQSLLQTVPLCLQEDKINYTLEAVVSQLIALSSSPSVPSSNRSSLFARRQDQPYSGGRCLSAHRLILVAFSLFFKQVLSA